MGLINAIGEIIAAIVGAILQLFVDGVDLIGKKNHDENASFGNKRKVVTYSKSASLYIGDDAIDPVITMTSAAIIGRTGASKSASVYKPTLLQTPKPKQEEGDPASMSYIVLDPARELERDTAGWNHEQGYLTETICFTDSKVSSVSWNPIEELTDSGVTRFTKEYIEIALKTDTTTSDPFWGISAQRTLRCAINILRAFGSRFTNLYNARYIVQLMSSESEELDKLVSLPKVSEEVFEEFASLKSMGEKLRGSVFATTLASLELFSDREIARVTSSTTLEMEEFRNRSKILFVQNKVMDQEYVSLLNTLLFTSFYNYAMSNIPDEGQNTLAFLFDEASSLRGMRPSLMSLASSNMRKHRSYFIAGYQSVNQMEDLYGKHARTVLQNVGTKLFFPHQDMKMSEEISQMLGRYTYQSEEGQKVTRPLLTPDQVSFLEHKDGAILFCGRERGILLKSIRPYYKSWRLSRRSKRPVPEREYVDTGYPELIPIKQIIRGAL